jgi:hypothetical protein
MMAEETPIQIPNRVMTTESNRPAPMVTDWLNWTVTIVTILGSICGFVWLAATMKSEVSALRQTVANHIEVDEIRQTTDLKDCVKNHSPYREDQKVIASSFDEIKTSLNSVKGKQETMIANLTAISVRQEDVLRRLTTIEQKVDKQNGATANSRIHDDYER